MMMNIFSNFDPSWFNLCYKNFMAVSTAPMITMSMFWMKPNKLTLSISTLKSYTMQQSSKTKLKLMKSSSTINSSMFILIIYMNLSGMLPYMFSFTSHIIFTISLGLPLWYMSIMSSTLYSTKKMIAHFLPDSAPMWLNPFLVLIESISTMVRPVTLSFRLAANMTAGHVVMTLMSSFSIMSMKTLMITIISSMMYIMFELMICMIQSYIFCLLISLYTNDHS